MNELGLPVNTATFLKSQVQYKLAEQIIRRALKVYEKTNGSKYLNVLRSMTLLGRSLDYQGKYDDAENLFQKILKVRQRTLRRKHELTLSTISPSRERVKSEEQNTKKLREC